MCGSTGTGATSGVGTDGPALSSRTTGNAGGQSVGTTTGATTSSGALWLASTSGSDTASSGSTGGVNTNGPALSSQYIGGSNSGEQGDGTNQSGTLSGSDLWFLYGSGLGTGTSSSDANDGCLTDLLLLLSHNLGGSNADGQGHEASEPQKDVDLWTYYARGTGAGSADGSLAFDPTTSIRYTGGSGGGQASVVALFGAGGMVFFVTGDAGSDATQPGSMQGPDGATTPPSSAGPAIGVITPLVYQFGSDEGPGFHSGVWTGDDGGVQFVTVSDGDGAPPPEPEAAAASIGLFDWWWNLWRSEAKPATPPVDQPLHADIPAVGLPDQLPATRPDGTLDPVLNNSVDQAAIAAGKLVFDPVTRSWTSPGGLEYGPLLFADGNAVNHVLDHLVPNSAKKHHTVFAVDRTKRIETIDEAFGKRDNGVPRGDYRKFEIDMGSIIGTNGETRIRIVILDGTRKVITAYPIN